MTGATHIPEALRGLCDDAAIFPPGRMPLEDAVPAHVRHEDSDYAELVGPLVLSAKALADLPPLVADLDAGSLPLTVTAPAPDAVTAVLATVEQMPALDLVSLEVAVPESMAAEEVLAALAEALAGRLDLLVYVEVPRDARRTVLLAALADSPYRAKFRTGGVEAKLYPDEAELAEAISAAVEAELAFKATAGLHHAVRNTDPETGFEQQGFLNMLLAVDAALQGQDTDALAAILADRDGEGLARRFAELPPQRAAAVREAFVSFGTCSVTDPLTELAELGLIEQQERVTS